MAILSRSVRLADSVDRSATVSDSVGCFVNTLLLTAIFLLALRFELVGGDYPVKRPNKDTLALNGDGLTFRRISPRQFGTNSADFFLQDTEVTNEQYERYLKQQSE